MYFYFISQQQTFTDLQIKALHLCDYRDVTNIYVDVRVGGPRRQYAVD